MGELLKWVKKYNEKPQQWAIFRMPNTFTQKVQTKESLQSYKGGECKPMAQVRKQKLKQNTNITCCAIMKSEVM